MSNHQWSDLVRHAWYFENLREWLRKGVVTFSYWKKDGTIREAKGTLNDLFIPLDKRPKGNTPPSGGWGALNYFDLDRNDWRSFAVTHYIGFVTVWELKER